MLSPSTGAVLCLAAAALLVSALAGCRLGVRFLAGFWRDFEAFAASRDWAAGHEDPAARPRRMSRGA